MSLKKCILAIEDVRFGSFILKKYGKNEEFSRGLRRLKETVERDRDLCMRFTHRMPHHPQYQNKIWKWDFQPPGFTSSTRKGWRLYGYVDDPISLVPIVIPFFCYPKSETPAGDVVPYLVEALRSFLYASRPADTPESKFRRQTAGDSIISLCYSCYATVAQNTDEEQVNIAETHHRCTTPESFPRAM